MGRKRKLPETPHLDTPQKNKIKGTHEYLTHLGIDHSVKDIGAFFGVTSTHLVHHAIQSKKQRESGDHSASSDNGEAVKDVQQFKILFNDRPIICERRGPSKEKPALIFTHGAGGGLANPASKDFAEGFAEISTVVAFQGTMNLTSRVKTFHAVVEHERTALALGGRSMGARAAAIAASETKQHCEALVLVSFPLTGGKKGESREQLLLNLPASIGCLFIIGSNDAQCELKQLRKVMGEMSANCWLVEVQLADHSMSWKHKDSVQSMRRLTGKIAAQWLVDRDQSKRYCAVVLNDEVGEPTLLGWETDFKGNPSEKPAPTDTKRRKR